MPRIEIQPYFLDLVCFAAFENFIHRKNGLLEKNPREMLLRSERTNHLRRQMSLPVNSSCWRCRALAGRTRWSPACGWCSRFARCSFPTPSARSCPGGWSGSSWSSGPASWSPLRRTRCRWSCSARGRRSCRLMTTVAETNRKKNSRALQGTY